MQVKTFSGHNAYTVLAQVKEELGANAVILSSRDIQKDGQNWHEVTAGIDSTEEKNTATGSIMSADGWNEWYKDWIKVKEHLYMLMQPSIQWEQLSPRHRTALEYLQREGVDESFIMELYQKLILTHGSSFLELLSEVIPVRPWSAEYWPSRIHAIAGPFGSGKTSAALRMALFLRQENPSSSIAFINADCSRGNNRLILRNWAELSEFGYFEANTPEDMNNAIAEFEEKDYIFIDLPSISDKGDTLNTLLTSIGLVDIDFSIHLALSPYYTSIQSRAFISRYQTQKVESIIWTKLDEAATYGVLVNIAMNFGLPISVLSYGAGLRDTFSPAYESLIWKLIFKHQLPGQR